MFLEDLKNSILLKKALEIEEGRLDLDPHLTPMVMYKDMGMYSKNGKHLKIHLKMFILYYMTILEIIPKKK